jgi:hypothetical protein
MVPVDDVVAQLIERGYSLTPDIIEFLQRFDRLDLNFVRDGEPDSAWIDAARAALEERRSWVQEYVRRTGVEMVPIGAAQGDYMRLFIASDGRFFGAYDHLLWRLGSDPEELLRLISTTGSAEPVAD